MQHLEQHLHAERIAAFDHEAPSSDELAHLAACAVCRIERNAFSALRQRSMHFGDGPTPPHAPRLTDWDALSKRLRAEGLMTGSAAHTPARSVASANTEPVALEPWLFRASPRTRVEWWRAAAAALLLAVGGAGLGRMSAGAPFLPSDSTSSLSVSAGVLNVGLGNMGYGSIDEATRALTRAERDYNRAALWLTANDPTGNTSDILRRRLAALDQMVAAAYAALEAAPQDLVLDRYYRSAYADRETTLQQLGGALPVGRSIGRF